MTQSARDARKPSGKVRLTLRPGDPGTKRWVEQYGDRLVSVRYRYDETRKRRLTTVEIVVEERAWSPVVRYGDPDQLVGVRIGYFESAVRQRVKEAGGQWDRAAKVWWLPLYRAVQYDLEDRITLWSKDPGYPDV